VCRRGARKFGRRRRYVRVRVTKSLSEMTIVFVTRRRRQPLKSGRRNRRLARFVRLVSVVKCRRNDGGGGGGGGAGGARRCLSAGARPPPPPPRSVAPRFPNEPLLKSPPPFTRLRRRRAGHRSSAYARTAGKDRQKSAAHWLRYLLCGRRRSAAIYNTPPRYTCNDDDNNGAYRSLARRKQYACNRCRTTRAKFDRFNGTP